MNRFAASSIALAVMAACNPQTAPIEKAPPEPISAESSGPVLSYTSAFVMAPLQGRDITMGGVTLSVAGGDVSLTSATSDAFGTIEFHTMSMTDGRMQMRQVEAFELADGETLTLARGTNHFMMYDPKVSLIPGDTVDITLNFDANGVPLTMVIAADVRAVGD